MKTIIDEIWELRSKYRQEHFTYPTRVLFDVESYSDLLNAIKPSMLWEVQSRRTIFGLEIFIKEQVPDKYKKCIIVE